MTERKSNYVIGLKVDGTVRVKREFEKVGDKGQETFSKISKSAKKGNAALRGVARNITSTLVPAFAAAASAASIFRNIQIFEKLDIRLRSLTNSAEDYANTQEFLKAKADELNVGVETLTNGYARLLVLQNSGVLNREQVNQLSEGLVNAAATLGASGADIDRVLFGLSQGLSSGTLRAEELNQVVEPLPGLLQELDKAAGLTAGGFRRMVNAGEVTSEFLATTLIKALESYDGAAKKLDGTISGSLTKLDNAWVDLARTIGETGVIEALAEITEAFAASIGVARKAVTGQIAFAEATGIVEKTAFIAARGVKAAFLVVQTVVLNFAQGILGALNAIQDSVLFIVNRITDSEYRGVEALRNLQNAMIATMRDNARQLASTFSIGPSEESIRALREQEERVKKLQREAEIARSKAEQERGKQERIAKAGPSKADKALIKQLENERKKIEQVTKALKFKNEQLLRDEKTQELYNQLQAAGVQLKSLEGQEIQRLVGEYFRLKEAKEQEEEVEKRKQKLIEEIKKITEDNISAQDKYNERMEELNELLKEGAISLEEFEAAGKQAYDQLVEASDKWFDGAKRALDKYAEEATDMAANVERVVTNAMQGLEDALVKATTTGKFEFKELVDSILEDVARLLVRTQITGPLAQGLSGLIGNIFGGQNSGSGGGFFGLFEKGAAFSRGQKVTAYARGGVVGKPTIFPMANGMGLMGEAGPEAVLPLTRTRSGRLGVESVGGAGNFFTVNVDARGSTDPAGTSVSVKRAVDEALNARIPGIVQTSAQLAHRKTVDNWQRRGSRFE